LSGGRRGRSHVDLVVVGAGAAGLAAAKTAREIGLDVVTFEAMDRIGGRAFTDEQTFGFPWDAGCHWLHSGSINPFARIAESEGFRYRTTSMPWNIWLGDRRSTAAEDAAADAFIEASLAAATRRARDGADVTLADVVDLDNPWLDVLKQTIEAEWGVDLHAASTLDIARYRDTHENWAVEQGYGALVARTANGVAVELNAPVETVDWSGSGVRVTTALDVVHARAVIVTVSTNVVADGIIAFDPPLPLWKQEAFAAIPLGRANKVALQFSPQALADVSEQSITVPIASGDMIDLRMRPFGRNAVEGYLGGPVAAALEEAGAAETIDVALKAIETVLGSEVRRFVRASAVTAWGKEPSIRGAYAAAIPGKAHLRPELARPVAGRIFFAGEATSPEFYSTCHGAWESGIAAAHAVAGVLRPNDISPHISDVGC
jgi:monoamine oxidase